MSSAPYWMSLIINVPATLLAALAVYFCIWEDNSSAASSKESILVRSIYDGAVVGFLFAISSLVPRFLPIMIQLFPIFQSRRYVDYPSYFIVPQFGQTLILVAIVAIILHRVLKLRKWLKSN